MPAEPPPGPALSLGPADTARLEIEGDPMAVRDGLECLFACKLLAGLSDESRDTAEIVLAEALNNIAEHAYAEHSGRIEVLLRRGDTDLQFDVIDRGRPMPGAEPPFGQLREGLAVEDLPEGGFGWFLIRSLAHSLAYRRVGGCNRLSFCVAAHYLP